MQWEAIIDGVKVAQMASTSEAVYRLLYLEKGVIFPQHCYTEAVESLFILWADEAAEMGQCEQWLKPIENDSFHYFFRSSPKMIKVLFMTFKVY